MLWKIAGILIFAITGIAWLISKFVGFLLLGFGEAGQNIIKLSGQAEILLPVGLFLIVMQPNKKGIVFAAIVAVVFWYAAHVWMGLI